MKAIQLRQLLKDISKLAVDKYQAEIDTDFRLVLHGQEEGEEWATWLLSIQTSLTAEQALSLWDDIGTLVSFEQLIKEEPNFSLNVLWPFKETGR